MIATTSQLLWYATRATGVVALVLLTATVVLGIATTSRLSTYNWPGFAWQDIHRRMSLLSVVFVGLHVLTTVTDAYVPIGWVSAVVPFASPYKTFWMGLGTLSVDLMLAVVISSLLRRWIDAGVWRALHWLAYASWPVAVAHTLGTGTDARFGWMLVLVACCVGAVAVALSLRFVARWTARAGARLPSGSGMDAVYSAQRSDRFGAASRGELR
jgi:methionine sulfoxide reductase heme-binding subunit